ncbi:MAG: hypothetical protein HDT30_15310 [Clostridiales bacterium]|nr:hypothetical protein [Clostridiales bacterium]
MENQLNTENQSTEKQISFESVSFIGRISYGIMCEKEYLLQGYPYKDWAIILEVFCKITDLELELWDDWMDETIEIIPQYLFKFDNYKSSDFEFLTEDKYNTLKKFYGNINEDVNIFLKMVYDLANSHAYSSIKGKGEESLRQLREITTFLEEKEILLPDIEKVQTHLFSDKNGWGNPFDGTNLSKIIKKY